MANPKSEEILNSVQSSYAELTALVNGELSELDSALLYRRPDPNEWTVMEILAHLVELMPYWGNEVEKLLANPGQNFGRTHEDEVRLAAVHNHGSEKLEYIKAALPESFARLEEVLATLKDSDLALTGVHSRRGEHTLDYFMPDFVTEHLKGHISQIHKTLNALK